MLLSLEDINERRKRMLYTRGYQREKKTQHLQGFWVHWLIFPVYIGVLNERKETKQWNIQRLQENFMTIMEIRF